VSEGGKSSQDAGGGSGGSTGTGTGGGSGSDTCVKGQTKGNSVAVCGESFIAMTHGLTKELEALATAAGSLKSGEHYDDESVSGTWMSQGAQSIPNQYKTAQSKNDIKYVVMDGGGNDCMNGGTGDNIITAATTLFKQMATDGVLKVVYFWMPDPNAGTGHDALKSCLDVTRPKIKSLCEGLTSPKCYYVDLRESWNGHTEYAVSDGIHPTAAGDKASAKQIWETMVKNCVAQ
jgi:lysophospholipase L1-like esterase